VTSHVHLKTRVLVVVVVLANVLGNALLSRGMRHLDTALGPSLVTYLRVFVNPWVAVGVVLLILWLLSRMALLSWADLSYVLPVTSIGYVLTAVAGAVFLGEHVSAGRWAGTVLIMAGTALVGSTAVNTRAPDRARSEARRLAETMR
jgi:uncharacterized membrane protein